MKSLIQYIILLISICVILWFFGTRFEKLRERESSKSPYTLYDPFEEENEQLFEKKIENESKATQDDLAVVESTTEPIPTEVVSTEPEIEVIIDQEKISASISLSQISTLIFGKSQGKCKVDRELQGSLRRLKSLLLTIEPILPKSDDFKVSSTKIPTKTILKNNIFNLSFQNKGRPQLVGLYLCSDESNARSCSDKPSYNATNTNDAVFHFSYLHFDSDDIYLSKFPKDTDQHIDAFFRKIFGPADPSNKAYSNAKALYLGAEYPIKLETNRTGLSILFPKQDSSLCQNAESTAPDL